MKKNYLIILFLMLCINASAQTEKLGYHEIKTDEQGNILPWYSNEPGKAWSHVIQLVWNFWDAMRIDLNGLPYYMNHPVWKPEIDDPRGIGGDQFSMALSSWRLLYAYNGDERIVENMKFIADYYLSHGFSASNIEWANVPYPYNTLVYSGRYDGDMVLGKNYLQPDKAGSFGIELLNLYEMVVDKGWPTHNVTDEIYLSAAIKIANTLARHTKVGDENNSPMPFKVNALTGEIGTLRNNNWSGEITGISSYTSNWSSTLELFLELQKLNLGETGLYKQAFSKIINWMKKYPLHNNKWGPFFEDIPGWSDTQINAITFAQFMMNHPDYFPNWKTKVRKIFDWVYEKFGNDKWKNYGVTVVNEQTIYHQPGNSHTSREASAELQYMALTADRFHYDNAIRQLNWATYMVDSDGKNKYPDDGIWLTDGYGDYVRHFLRAMAAMPQLAPSDEDHLLKSSSIVQDINYGHVIDYQVYGINGIEIFHLKQKPLNVLFNDRAEANGESFTWDALKKGGILTIKRTQTAKITIVK